MKHNTNKDMSSQSSETSLSVPEKMPEAGSKIARYYVARKKGKNKTESAFLAGYASNNHTDRLERTAGYKAIDNYFQSEVLKILPMANLAKLAVRNANQERDLGASNGAVKMILEQIDKQANGGQPDEQVIVVLSKRTYGK